MATLQFKDGMVHNTHQITDTVGVSANERAMIVGPIEVTSTGVVNLAGSLTVMHELNINGGTVNVQTGGTLDVR